MRLKITGISKVCSNGMLLVLLLLVFACGGKEPATKQPAIKFDQSKWSEKKDGQYIYRKQMVSDILTNYQWTGVAKDSVIRLLGQPDDTAEGNLSYFYETEPFLGGLGTTIEAVVFELAPDSTVKLARLNDGGWD